MKKLFRDLFERQGYTDDGIFDWDIKKRQQSNRNGQAGADGAENGVGDGLGNGGVENEVLISGTGGSDRLNGDGIVTSGQVLDRGGVSSAPVNNNAGNTSLAPVTSNDRHADDNHNQNNTGKYCFNQF